MSEEFDALKFLTETLNGKTIKLASSHEINFPVGWKSLIIRIVGFGEDLPIEICSVSRNIYEQLQFETNLQITDEVENGVLLEYINFLRFCRVTELMSLTICIECGSKIGLRHHTKKILINGVCRDCKKVTKEDKTGTWLDNY